VGRERGITSPILSCVEHAAAKSSFRIPVICPALAIPSVCALSVGKLI